MYVAMRVCLLVSVICGCDWSGGEHKGRLPYPIRNLQSAYLVCKYTNYVCVICCAQTWLGCKLCVHQPYTCFQKYLPNTYQYPAWKVRCWVAVHVPEVCVQNGEFCSNAGSLNHSIKCNKDMYVLCEFKNILYDVKVSPNYFVHALSHVFR